jgi:hypothetical protein
MTLLGGAPEPHGRVVRAVEAVLRAHATAGPSKGLSLHLLLILLTLLLTFFHPLLLFLPILLIVFLYLLRFFPSSSSSTSSRI